MTFPNPIVSLGVDARDAIWMSRHQILHRLAARHRVLNVPPPAELRADWDTLPRLRPAVQPTVAFGEGFTPPVWAARIYRPRVLQSLHDRSYAAAIGLATRQLGFARSVLYVWDPTFLRVARHLRHGLLCYHCYDDYSQYGAEGSAEILEAEHALARAADVVFATSPMLQRKLQQAGARAVVLLPHGVAFDTFAMPRAIPADLDAVPRPRLGYIGRLTYKVDYGLLYRLAQEAGPCSLVLVGPLALHRDGDRVAFQRLTALPNVHYLGVRPQEDVPAYIQHLDVGLLAYSLQGHVPAINPLKFLEHLACGTPVVSSPLDVFAGVRDVVTLATDVASWKAAIARTLDPCTRPPRETLQAYARHNTWDTRVALVEQTLSAALEGHV